jgi:hypothetical protein
LDSDGANHLAPTSLTLFPLNTPVKCGCAAACCGTDAPRPRPGAPVSGSAGFAFGLDLLLDGIERLLPAG